MRLTGRGLHSSKFQLNLSRFVSLTPTTDPNQRIPQKMLTLSRKVDECKPLLTGLRGAAHLNGREGVVRGADPANSMRVAVCFEDGSEVKPSTHRIKPPTSVAPFSASHHVHDDGLVVCLDHPLSRTARSSELTSATISTERRSA